MTQWRLDAPGQTLALAVTDGLPFVIWWGPTLPQDEDLATLQAAGRSDLTGGMLDRLPDLTLCPLPAADWQGQPGWRLPTNTETPFIRACCFRRLRPERIGFDWFPKAMA